MRRAPLLALLASLACGGSHAAENSRAKARIFAPAEAAARPPLPTAIDLDALGGSLAAQDALLGQSETEAAARVGAFRLKAKLTVHFSGASPGGGQNPEPGGGPPLELVEDRLVEQAANGDLHLRLLDSTGEGMEILWVARQAYGRSRYGPFVARDRLSGLTEQRDEVFGAVRALYLLSDRGWQLSGRGPGVGCRRFAVSSGTPRPEEDPSRFAGRLDADTARRFQFRYRRTLARAAGELCVDPRGLVTDAQLALDWSAAGDAGTGEVRVELAETLSDLGGAVHVAAPEAPRPEPHRPRGPFATLSRFGFILGSDGGSDRGSDGGRE